MMTEICEAYDVLSNHYFKEIFDQYGEEILKEGAPSRKNFKGGYSYHGDNLEVFKQFFGTSNPYCDISLPYYETIDDIESEFDIVVTIKCTLLEFYYGCTKDITYVRRILRKDGKTTKDVEESKRIEIKPGYSNKTSLRYPKLGHEEFTKTTTALIINFEQIPEPNIKRIGNDLTQIVEISLADALQAKSVSLVTLTGERIELSSNSVITPQTKEKVEGYGMPIYVEGDYYSQLLKNASKGDLYIVFDIKFPQTLTQDQKDELTELLKEDDE